MTKARRLGARPAEAQDEILIQGIRIPCALGVTATERKMRRPVLVDLELGLDLERAGITDRLSDTVDYGAVYQVVEEVANQRDYRLVESLCEEIIEAIYLILVNRSTADVLLRVRRACHTVISTYHT